MTRIHRAEPSYRAAVIASTASEALNILVRTIISILVARLMGPALRGEYALALLVPGLFITFTYTGIGEGTATILTRGSYSREKALGNLILAVSVLSLALAGLFFGAETVVMRLINHNLPPALYHLAYFYIPVNLLWFALSPVALALGIVREVTYGRLVNNILFLSGMGALALCCTFTPERALALFLACGVAELIYLCSFIFRRITPDFSPALAIIRDELRFGWSMFWQTLFGHLNKRLDFYILGYLAGNFVLGIYAVAVGVTEFLLTVPTVFSRAAFSFAVRAQANDAAAVPAAAVRQIFYILLCAALALGLIMHPLVKILYSAAFMPAVVPAVILLPGMVALGLVTVLGQIFIGLGMPAKLTAATGTACLCTVILDLLLIPRFGVVGASIASTISYTISAGYLMAAYLRHSGLPAAAIFQFRPAEDLCAIGSELRRMAGQWFSARTGGNA